MTKKNNPDPERGWFITFEGGEGSGKSTQIELLGSRLREIGHDVVVTREPGGSVGGEAVRQVLLSGSAEHFGPDMEAILFAAARSDHVEMLIRPALEAGSTVLCDRFFDSTRVYQGGEGGADPGLLDRLEAVACEGCWPDITVILDLDPAEGMERAAARRKAGADPDRFEKDALQRQQMRRQAYLNIAQAEPLRCIVIDAGGDEEEVGERVWSAVEQRMRQASPGWQEPHFARSGT